MVKLSQLVAEQRWIKELDINPLLASPDQLLALDARVVVHGLDVTEDQLPKLAVRPYPIQYVKPWLAKDKQLVTIRPIRPEDEPALVKFHETLSDRSVYLRYLHPMLLSQRVAHERLARICFNDYDREMALVVEREDPQTGEPLIMAVGRLSKVAGTNEAAFHILVNDQFQGLGLGTELLKRLIEVGHDEKLDRIIAQMSADNQAMQGMVTKLGFHLEPPDERQMVKAQLNL
jgi:acetyltransferase